MNYFKQSEFDQKGLAGSGANMDRELVVHLNELRRRCGFAFIITSGYRSPEYNKQVSSTGEDGPHTTGKAVDIKATSRQKYVILREALAMGVFTGIGIGKDFIHLDTLITSPRPNVWTY